MNRMPNTKPAGIIPVLHPESDHTAHSPTPLRIPGVTPLSKEESDKVIDTIS